ncbi:toxin-antitoxin system, antitoxin component, Xre family [Trichinella spiralis]|uniref:toxin-antitoxin system, antitoxin component, Xre family n=1 Tax=Trichinella spiralis TaxID=6334 RepID=UPI0001EFC69E|nr:toxin-antitoxin system, antitoxin component, Xre family [Trichinella spiralis]
MGAALTVGFLGMTQRRRVTTVVLNILNLVCIHPKKVGWRAFCQHNAERESEIKPLPSSERLEMADSCGSARLTTSIMEKAESHLPGSFVRRHQTSAGGKSFGRSDGRSILGSKRGVTGGGGLGWTKTDGKMHAQRRRISANAQTFKLTRSIFSAPAQSN